MITIQDGKPKIIRSYESDFGTTHAESIWKRVIQYLNWWNASLPVGLVMSIYQSQTFASGSMIPLPSGHWKWMDGSTVSNPLSPLNGQSIPNLRGYFLKGSSSFGSTGGSSDLNLSHSHGGFTGITDDTDRSSVRLDNGGERNTGSAHKHSMSTELSSYNKLPPFVELQYYLNVAGASAQNNFLVFTQLNDNIVDFGDIVSVELLNTIRLDIEYINVLMPVGGIWPIMTNIPGVTINPNVWQECNGSQITNIHSPLKGTPGQPRFTPNMSDRYIKFPTSLGLVGSPGGTNTYSGFGHDHGGITSSVDYTDDSDTDDDFNTATGHSHTVSSDLTGTYNMEPPYYTVKFYMKIQ